MRKIIIYTLFLLIAVSTSAFAQKKSFAEQAKAIAENIQIITQEQKAQLKVEIDAIDKKVKEGKITVEDAKELKEKIAKERASNIELQVAKEQERLATLIDEEVEKGMNKEDLESKSDSIFIGVKSDSTGTTLNIPAMKFYKSKNEKKRTFARTQSQFVFAIGLNNLATDGNLSSVENSDFKAVKSHFFEWGYVLNTRIFEHSNFFHAKYGLSLMYNNLQAKDELVFMENGNQTILVDYGEPVRKAKFRSVQLVVPLHLEFDFTPIECTDDGGKYTIQNSVRMGIGGYGGLNIKNKQKIFTEGGDKIKQKKDFNTSTFIYGASAYIGYKSISLYAKYDFNNMFTDNIVPQNNISYGLRFDFN